MYVNAWVAFSAAAVLELSAGVGYTWSCYSEELKQVLGYTQAQIQGVVSPLFANIAIGLLPGLAVDAIAHHHRIGPRLMLAAGLAIHATGYLGLWLAARGRLAAPYWAVVGLGVTALNGAVWMDTVAVATTIRNFPAHRGASVGVLKSLVGIGASLYTGAYRAFFQPDAPAFLLCVTLLPLALGALVLPCLNSLPFVTGPAEASNAAATGRRLATAQVAAAALGLYQLGGAALGASVGAALQAGLLAGAAVLFTPLLLLPLGTGGWLARAPQPAALNAEVDTGKGFGPGAESLRPLVVVDCNAAPACTQSVSDAAVVGLRIAGEPIGGGATLLGLGEAVHCAAMSAPQVGALASHASSPHAQLSSSWGEAARFVWSMHPEPAENMPRPAAPVCTTPLHPGKPGKASQQAASAALREPLLAAGAGAAKESQVAVWRDLPARPDHTLAECATSVDYWLLVAIFGTGTASGMMYVNNLGQLSSALGGPADPARLVSLFSIMNAAGRLAGGCLPDSLSVLRRLPRPLFLVWAAAATAVAAALAAAATGPRALWAASPAAGFALGCHWSLVPAMTAELFGMRHFAKLYCLLQAAVSVGAYGLGTKLAGELYQARAAAHGDASNVCLGADCFRGTFQITAGLETVMVGLAVVLYLRTRRRYY